MVARAFALIFTLPLVLSGQEPNRTNTNDPLIQALVTEIRELRLALERSQILTLRFHAALQANQIRADRLKDLSQQLNVVRSQIAGTTAQTSRLAREIETIERVGPQSPDPALRRELEQQVPQLKAELESANKQLAELTARESFLLAEIQRENTQMEDWSRWLQQFEQLLQPAR